MVSCISHVSNYMTSGDSINNHDTEDIEQAQPLRRQWGELIQRGRTSH